MITLMRKAKYFEVNLYSIFSRGRKDDLGPDTSATLPVTGDHVCRRVWVGAGASVLTGSHGGEAGSMRCECRKARLITQDAARPCLKGAILPPWLLCVALIKCDIFNQC